MTSPPQPQHCNSHAVPPFCRIQNTVSSTRNRLRRQDNIFLSAPETASKLLLQPWKKRQLDHVGRERRKRSFKRGNVLNNPEEFDRGIRKARRPARKMAGRRSRRRRRLPSISEPRQLEIPKAVAALLQQQQQLLLRIIALVASWKRCPVGTSPVFRP